MKLSIFEMFEILEILEFRILLFNLAITESFY